MFRKTNLAKQEQAQLVMAKKPRKRAVDIDEKGVMARLAAHQGTRASFIEQEGLSTPTFYRILKDNGGYLLRDEPVKRHKQSQPIVATPAGMRRKPAAQPTSASTNAEQSGIVSQDDLIAYLTKENANLKRLLANAWRVAIE